jgi:hypothetical protein
MLADLHEMQYKHDFSGSHLYVVISDFLQLLSHSGIQDTSEYGAV